MFESKVKRFFAGFFCVCDGTDQCCVSSKCGEYDGNYNRLKLNEQNNDIFFLTKLKLFFTYNFLSHLSQIRQKV